MSATHIESDGTRPCWFVGAMFQGNQDQTGRFVSDGVWENESEDNLLDTVRSIRVGDRIAIKATYTRKAELPFDNRKLSVSVMAIKAVGVVTDNPGDGHKLGVEWQADFRPREWYFYTNLKAIWKVMPGEWRADDLIQFAFDGKSQDLDRFRNSPDLKERFGDRTADVGDRFAWTSFYESFADALLGFRDRRSDLVTGLQAMVGKVDGMPRLEERLADGTMKPMQDICPFTVMGMFNRGITVAKRMNVAREIAAFLGVSDPVPESFDGIPLLNNMSSWFFTSEAKDRGADDIACLWEVFAESLEFGRNGGDQARSAFIYAYNKAASNRGVGWNLTMGLYWVRPWAFPPLDSLSRVYIQKKLGFSLGLEGPKGRSSADDYLEIKDRLTVRFNEDEYPVHSFPELSLAAWKYVDPTSERTSRKWIPAVSSRIQIICNEKGSNEFSRQEFLTRYLKELQEEFSSNNSVESSISFYIQKLRDKGLVEFVGNGEYRWLGPWNQNCGLDDADFDSGEGHTDRTADPYMVGNIIKDGSFLDVAELEKMLDSLRKKKNLILQGAPGTGKTWLAKRLGFALIGERNEHRLRSVQFHANLSYEDFVRGFRPGPDGILKLVDGPFMQMIRAAAADVADNYYVMVIEEINRGNPAQIFGEMLTLLESDKRTPDESLELSYRMEDDERVHIPANLFVIGTMNIADRSLALVDMALRRRFAFFTLKPCFNQVWFDWVVKESGFDAGALDEIRNRVAELNGLIGKDRNLGPQFAVGHSYLTPRSKTPVPDAAHWFSQIVETEIGPLLEEYWFDDRAAYESAMNLLRKGM